MTRRLAPAAPMRAPSRTIARAVVAAHLCVVGAAGPLGAQAAPPATAPGFELREVMIRARDGVGLHTLVYTPTAARGPLPIVFRRTPYGVANAARSFAGPYKELADDGYIFAFQDIRGRYGSEGTFVMQRAPRGQDKRSIDEGTDAYDSIEWLVKNVPNNNGRVGMLGVSYDGWTTVMATLEPHPALKAVSPQASPADMWIGDDFHHNGAFRLSYGFEYAALMETSKENAGFTFDRRDTYDWYLALGALSNANAKYLKGKFPTWNDFVAHPDYDRFWKRQTMIPHLTAVRVPTLNVAGWWDQEDFYGPIRIYEALEKHDAAGGGQTGARGKNYLVVGPWNHGGWARGGDSLGDIKFGSATGRYFRERIQAPWFAYWLKDRGKLELPEALTFEAGSNRWRSWDAWPPKRRTEERKLYFHPGGTLSLRPPTASGAVPNEFDQYVSDPAHPVPYRQRPIEPTYSPHGSRWSAWLVEDQRFVDDRPDVLSWESEPLAEDMTIAGDVAARLFAATSGTDSDWIVKLIDVYPEEYPEDWKLAGRQLMVANEVLRGRYRDSFERPAPIPANAVVPYTIGLHTQNYTFKKGHRIMVQVQSSWFPLIDRNPQTFVPNIFEAKPSDFRAATQRVYRSARYPSHVSVQVVQPAAADPPVP